MRLPGGGRAAQTVAMRPVSAVLAVTGGIALAAAETIDVLSGNSDAAGWLLIGPAPFYAVGLAAALWRRDHRMSAWLLASGALALLDSFRGGAVLPIVAGSSWAGVGVLVGGCVANAGTVSGVGTIGMFPTGVIDGRGTRWTLRIAVLSGVLLPLLDAVSNRTMPADWPYQQTAAIASPLYWSGTAPLGPAVR